MSSDHVVPKVTSSIFRTEKLSELEEEYLDKVIKKSLPENYNFEVKKCVYRIRHDGYSTVSLQMPEGLLTWAQEISEILRFFCPSLKEVIIMGDVTYGACCIDDYTATSLDCDLVIHYGHSCLIPVPDVDVNCLYVFVEISFSPQKLASHIQSCFEPDEHLVMMGTIQYSNVIRECASILNSNKHFKYLVDIPQVSPLLPGEVLGCTSPLVNLKAVNKSDLHQRKEKQQQELETQQDPESESEIRHSIIFVADGRFHLESTLIQNPGIRLYRFDPFNKVFSEETYDLDTFHAVRKRAILTSRSSKKVCVVLSTLGRQGNLNILNNICSLLDKRNVKYFKLLLSEITIDKLKNLKVDSFIQIGCPRLSIDWGDSFPKPLLNPYEAYVAFSDLEYKPVYPMDYYSRSGGDWSNYTANSCCSDSASRKARLREAISQRLLQRSMVSKQIYYSQ